MSNIIVVDEDDKQIGLKNRHDITYDDIYRVAALWIKNSEGKVLLAQRNLNKTVDPGCWGPAVSGTVEAGETYESNIYKESKEELGLVGYAFGQFAKIPPTKDSNYFVLLFVLSADLSIDEDIVLQDSEVAQAAWFDVEYLENDIEMNPQNYVKTAPRWKSFGLLTPNW